MQKVMFKRMVHPEYVFSDGTPATSNQFDKEKKEKPVLKKGTGKLQADFETEGVFVRWDDDKNPTIAYIEDADDVIHMVEPDNIRFIPTLPN